MRLVRRRPRIAVSLVTPGTGPGKYDPDLMSAEFKVGVEVLIAVHLFDPHGLLTDEALRNSLWTASESRARDLKFVEDVEFIGRAVREVVRRII